MSKQRNILTLAQVGARLIDTYQKMTPDQRRQMTFQQLMTRLRVPVGLLRKS
jgi:hypothetical protein